MMNQTVEVNMTEDTSQKAQKEASEKATPIGRMTIGEGRPQV